MTRVTRAWYGATIGDFLRTPPDAVIGTLVQRAEVSTTSEEVAAWLGEIEVLGATLDDLDGEILLEYAVPRVGGRADAVIVLRHAVVIIEFKVGATDFASRAREQAWDYALDLKNFHRASHDSDVVPVVVATETSNVLDDLSRDADGVFRPVRASPNRLRELIDRVLGGRGRPLVVAEWANAPYQPTPTIVEAARALYARHSVAEIARSDAGARNLAVTDHCVEEIVAKAERYREKVVCFVTGVPGAGKTLVGLNVATKHRSMKAAPAVFLSGNAPLVSVLRAALVRDERERTGLKRGSRRSADVGTSVKAFIQNVHHFRDDALRDCERPPAEHVAIFDEAQRAWNRDKTADFMKRRKGIPDFAFSEPEFLLRYMDRHRDWAAVVCLVGGGQEIHTGEAGIGEWLIAIREHLPHWGAVISSRLTGSEYEGGCVPALIAGLPNVTSDDRLHLATSMRSFRAEHVSSFVKAMLDLDTSGARELLTLIHERYPIALTRDLATAKRWLRDRARGSERIGVVASSKAMRLKAVGLDVRVKVDPVQWFLHGRDDVRSSYYLEDVATEFQIQGLEIDWACVTWDGDLRRSASGWSYHDFRGTRWTNVWKDDHRRYMLNSYRVLLTRARQGMIVYVPQGDAEDHTRLPEFYDRSFDYLRELGLPVV